MAMKIDVGIVNEPLNYHIGDAIAHWNYGLGTVVAIEKKEFAGIDQLYYVVEVKRLQIWVPVEEAGISSMRFSCDPIQFEPFFDILRTPGEQLADHQYQRSAEPQEYTRKKTLADLCLLTRDLMDRSRQQPLNQNDTMALSRAEELLLDEWVHSLGVERSSALDELETRLQRELTGVEKRS